MSQTTDIISLDHRKRGLEPQKLPGATFNEDIETLLDQIDQGLEEDNATNFKKLNIARKYGPLLWKLKSLVPHGQFKKVLKERFPQINYPKCNRWMYISKRESRVEAALLSHPDEAWGPMKMIDFLRGVWTPGDEQVDEEDSYGVTPDKRNEPDDEPYYSEIDYEADGLDEADLDESIEPTTQHPSAALRVSDSHDEDDKQTLWDTCASNAESEAREAGKAPVIPSSDGTVTLTVFSQDDHALFQGCLSKWEPTSIPVHGNKDTSHLKVTVTPQQISDLLLQLGKTLKKSLPSQLKVSVEL